MYMNEAKMKQYLGYLDRLDNLILEHGSLDDAMSDFRKYLDNCGNSLSVPSRLLLCDLLEKCDRNDVLTLMLKLRKLMHIDLDAYMIYNITDKKGKEAHRKAVIASVMQPMRDADLWIEFFTLEGHLK